LVTANYKLSLDHLRRELEGFRAWIVVLETHGVNVWCAAGKGTFGTDELVHRLETTNVAQRLTHRTVVLPQLGAPGVAAQEVARRTGFKVVYGPVYARDLPAFLNAGMKATSQMRRIGFSLGERLAVAPVELVQRFIPAVSVLCLFLLLSGVTWTGYQFKLEQWPWLLLVVASNYLTGNLLIPLLLPWLPGRSFALKGGTAGAFLGCGLFMFLPFGLLESVALGLVSVAACSFMGLMFTGCTPYTSASGVRKEMKWALPIQIIIALFGVAGWLTSRLV
jgi:acetyl-CoA decarbonylase/synthase complex subunit gamma